MELKDILSWLYVIGAVILLFGAAVFVHEFGHFWVALKRKMKVEAFAIGFGPKIFSWKKDGIDYSWRWIPAGGFVRIPQMVTSDALEGKDKNSEPIPPAPPLSKILVAFAGPFMNIVFAFVIAIFIYFVGLPVLINPSIVGYVDPDSPEAKLGIREGDKIVAVDGRPTKSWSDVQMATILARTNMVPITLEREGKPINLTLEAKVNDTLGGKYLNLDSKDHPELTDVMDGAAKEAGLKPKDVVLKFAGVNVSGINQLKSLIEQHPGEKTSIEVQRGTQKLTLEVTPRGEKGGKGKLGVALGPNSVNVYEIQYPTPWESISDVWIKTFQTLGAVTRPKETGVGPKDLSGPIGIFALLASQVKTDYRLALNFLILLNVNLAILNLLPVPVLDGGHIVMSMIEAVRKRPLSARFQEYATTVFAVLLISFMVYVSFHDVKRFRLFRTLFQQETQIENSNSNKPAPAEAPAR